MQARLTIECGDGTPPACELPRDRPVTLGRNRSNTIVLQDKHASRWHAEIVPAAGGWLIKDCGTLNGTRLNGTRIQQPTLLADGHEIAIGDTRLRVRLTDVPEAAPPAAEQHAAGGNGRHQPENCNLSLESSVTTVLRADELTALCRFMSDSLGETSFRDLVEQALETIHKQTGATVVGFLSLDADNPEPKLVYPALAHVDIHLSRQLTQKVQREGRVVWLAGAGDDGLQSDSLLSFRDALCLPLQGGGAPFGALHVYKSGQMFVERELVFCKVLTGYLASALQVLRSQRHLEAENSRLRGGIPAVDAIIGDSPAMTQLRQQVARVAGKPCTVLITGESGSGKELVALALHRSSSRRDGPLVIVNCAAITATLPEAELFGHCRGAFTGADRDRAGFFQQAEEGTLFLDEIGELSLECQAKLLRAIETKAFRPVGSTGEVQADVRILAATHRDLEQLVRDGRFRQDLFYRLGIPLKVPPLRDHAEDIPALVEHFLPRLRQEYHRPLRLTPAALERLREFPWPGNVRQLRTVLEYAVAMTDGDVIDAADLGLEAQSAACSDPPPSLNLEELEEWAIRKVLTRTRGNVAQAARALGIHRDTLTAKLKKYGIEREEG